MYNDITTIILTKNEEKNIKKCIESVKKISKRIIVVDSFSDDATVEIAESLGAEVKQNNFLNHGNQWNYAVSSSSINTKWIMRLDADEELTIEAAKTLSKLCEKNLNTDINGIVFRFKIKFMGKYLMHGGTYPVKRLSCYKNATAFMSERNLNDQLILNSGSYVELESDVDHNDYKDLNYWISKHNWYATGAAVDYLANLNTQEDFSKYDSNLRKNRILKSQVYYKLPVRWRSKLNFLYRYYFKLGFLDGIEGYYYAFFQAYWYRVLVDAKIQEYKKMEIDINSKSMNDLKS